MEFFFGNEIGYVFDFRAVNAVLYKLIDKRGIDDYQFVRAFVKAGDIGADKRHESLGNAQ
jgi:hypothetical protein